MVEISIVMPIYNSEEYLDLAVNTILNQSFKDFELICIDDGSIDGSLFILRKLASKDDRITIITQDNQGAGAARNAGLDMSRGKYVLFLDSDDFFDENLLKNLYECAE